VSASVKARLPADGPPPSWQHLFVNRVRCYPKAVSGPLRSAKWAVLVFCLTVYYVTPWLRWDRGPGRPDQAVLLDLPHRRFYFFWVEFWPQDIYFLTGGLILAAVSLFLVTSVVGRVWCGFACPQTVWTDLFLWIERRLEGDRNERMRRDQGHLTIETASLKLAKHAIWLAIAFWTGGAWIMYYIDAPTLVHEFWTGTASVEAYVMIGVFTAFTYLLGGWARELVCTYMCPWPRFQASMLDEQSLIVTYQGWRGEPRGHGKRAAAPGAEKKLGDCIDCHACVNACPTGIDIRDGVQLECINCGLCIDACNEMMVKVGLPKWLITWDTLEDQKAKAAGTHTGFRVVRPRTLVYGTALALVVSVMSYALATRPGMGITVIHDRAPLFVPVKDGSIRNGYTLRIANRGITPASFDLQLAGLQGGTMALAEGGEARTPTLQLPVDGDAVATFRVLVFGTPTTLIDGAQPMDFVLRNRATGELTTYRSTFMGR
jgi:cytochrome c oxidase accessory protein FixG